MHASPYSKNHNNEDRKIGIEIEFTGLKIDQIADILISVISGKASYVGKYECSIEESDWKNYGSTKIELDASLLKNGKLPDYLNKLGIKDPKFTDSIESFLSEAAMEVVPMEIVTPPIPLSEISTVEKIREALRVRAAEGTKKSVLNAFGLHLNPEVPSLDASELRDFLRSFVILYEWLIEKLEIDTSRKITPYIDPFPVSYAKLILQPDYNPSISELIDDYLEHNPTRNRPLDMLPLFTFIDKKRVLDVIDDGLTSARPTFHYRLPNCELSNPDWTITKEWNYWVMVERIAHSKEKLSALSGEFLEWQEKPGQKLLQKLNDKVTSFFS